jgi:hypothetical protein
VNIPLQPTKPLEGVASLAQQAPRHYIPRVLSPQRFWAVAKAGAILNRAKGISGAQVALFLIPKGFPGSGLLRGSTNIAKTLTYSSNADAYTAAMDEERILRNNRRQKAREWAKLEEELNNSGAF